MSDMEHPKISPSRGEVSLQENIAREMFALLNAYKRVGERRAWGYILPEEVTDRVEIDEEGAAYGTRVARLLAVPVLAVMTDRGALRTTRSDEYYVMEVQHGTYMHAKHDGRDGERAIDAVDKEFKWETYVTAAVNTHDTSNVAVLDGRGRDLGDTDLMMAQFVLQHLREQFFNYYHGEDIGTAAGESRAHTIPLANQYGSVFDMSNYVWASQN